MTGPNPAPSERDKEKWADDTAKNPDDLDGPSRGSPAERWSDDTAKNPDDLETPG